MSVEVVDRSLAEDETIIIEFETGPRFEVPKNISVREVAAHLLTPNLENSELESILRKIHAAGEEWAMNSTSPDFSILVDGEKADLDTILREDSMIEISE